MCVYQNQCPQYLLLAFIYVYGIFHSSYCTIWHFDGDMTVTDKKYEGEREMKIKNDDLN